MTKTFKLSAKIYKKHSARYIKISKNQLRILESLFRDGSKKKRYYDKDKNLKFTEHSGLLDFGKSTLQRIIINAKQNITDDLDDILLPDNMPDAFDFEYMFHTHPETPDIGSRAKDGILYEFPSVSDIFHFIDHHNMGITQGSIIIAPEGLYIIKCIVPEKKISLKNEKKMTNYLHDEFFKIQNKAIKKYGSKISKNIFYNKIISDKTFIKLYNESLKEFNIKIFYKSRIKSGKEWILNDLYLKIKPVE